MAILNIEELVKLSTIYNNKHKVRKSDLEVAEQLKQAIESRVEEPTPGDMIMCVGPGKAYTHSHLERAPEEYSSICVSPFTPFVFIGSNNNLLYSTSGGYWISIEEGEKLEYKGKVDKLFKTWGHCGPCADGAFHFKAEVNLWKFKSDRIY